MNEILITMKELTTNLLKRIDDIAELFSQMRVQEGNIRFGYLIEDLAVLIEGLSAISSKQVFVQPEEIQEKLLLILQEQENEDYVLLADLLLYELKPILELIEEQYADA